MVGKGLQADQTSVVVEGSHTDQMVEQDLVRQVDKADHLGEGHCPILELETWGTLTGDHRLMTWRDLQAIAWISE